ncbi:MAG: hypothetical protein ABW161_02625 [Candidatus Thiodiazotropha sp.]
MARYRHRNRLSPEVRREIDARQDVARQDMALGLAGLVRSAIRLKPGERRAYIEGLRQRWNGGVIEISGPEIDADDLGVLLALLAIAGREGGNVRPGGDVPGLLPATTRTGENAARESSTITVCTTMAEVCRETGKDPRHTDAAGDTGEYQTACGYHYHG